jgi:hypothetical protein
MQTDRQTDRQTKGQDRAVVGNIWIWMILCYGESRRGVVDHGNCHRHFPFDIWYRCDCGTVLYDWWPCCGRVWLHMGGRRAS